MTPTSATPCDSASVSPLPVSRFSSSPPCGSAPATAPTQRTLLAIGAPVILLIGGLRAFVRTYQTWRKQETWWAWQGAGWFLLTLMLIVLTMSMPPLAGFTG
jgi:hypothetical protein